MIVDFLQVRSTFFVDFDIKSFKHMDRGIRKFLRCHYLISLVRNIRRIYVNVN